MASTAAPAIHCRRCRSTDVTVPWDGSEVFCHRCEFSDPLPRSRRRRRSPLVIEPGDPPAIRLLKILAVSLIVFVVIAAALCVRLAVSQ